jgi:hypothetical protein
VNHETTAERAEDLNQRLIIKDLKSQIERMKRTEKLLQAGLSIAEDHIGKLDRKLSKTHAALERITRECDGLNKGPVAVMIAQEALKSN